MGSIRSHSDEGRSNGRCVSGAGQRSGFMAVHPLAALFPDVGPGELPPVAYAKDVETQGVRNPVEVQGSVFIGRPHAHEDLR